MNLQTGRKLYPESFKLRYLTFSKMYFVETVKNHCVSMIIQVCFYVEICIKDFHVYGKGSL